MRKGGLLSLEGTLNTLSSRCAVGDRFDDGWVADIRRSEGKQKQKQKMRRCEYGEYG